MASIKDDWNSMAKAYEEFNTAEDSYSYNIEWPCIKKMIPELSDKAVLDIGCGTGIFTFLLEQYKPSDILGIDISKEMLRIAEEKATAKNSKAKFVLGDVSNLRTCTDKKFDFIFSSTTSHYIKNLDIFMKGIYDSLNKNGTCILSVIHPVYSAMYPIKHGDTFPTDEEWEVRYLDKNLRSYIQPWIEYNDEYENTLSTSYHHLFSDYINSAIKAGLKINEVEEPMPPESWKDNCKGRYEGYIETPTYMIIKLERE